MMWWARMDQTGTLPLEMRTYPAPGWVAMPAGSDATLAALMLQDGVWVPRPMLPAAVEAMGPAGLIVIVEGLPDDAVITVHDIETGELLAVEGPVEGTVELMFADAGRYQLDASAPRPWMGWTIGMTA